MTTSRLRVAAGVTTGGYGGGYDRKRPDPGSCDARGRAVVTGGYPSQTTGEEAVFRPCTIRAETAHYLVLTSGETLRITGRRVSVRRPASTSTFRKSTCLAGHRARSGLSCRFGTQGTPDGPSYQGCLRRRTDRSASSSASAACPGVMSRSHSVAGPCGPADPVVLTSGTTGIQTSQPGISAHCSKWRHGTCGPGLDESCEPRWTLSTHASSGERLTTLSPQNICTGGSGVSKSEAARRRLARRALSDYPSASSWQAAR
ncbi:hypothetical protein YUMDRAFT_06534 [Streptomyces sp. OspMP-M45]|nr:hypothetical protein YUMDRAFT_06534 [Streptomyces sp. OspMP-M45]